MQLPHQTHDWTELANQIGHRPRLRDPWPGVKLLWYCFLFGIVAVLVRHVWIERTAGSDYRELAARPLERRIIVPPRRGRILARDGQVLAHDESIACVGLQYRWLEEPVDPQWLRSTARRRLTAAERRDPRRISDELQAVLSERQELHQRLQQLCGQSASEWEYRCRQIQQRVTHIRDAVNRARLSRWQAARANERDDSAWQRLRQILVPHEEESPPEPITVAEELDFQVVCERIAPDVRHQIEQLGQQFPAVRVVIRQQRHYPQQSTAAHLLGYLGAPEDQAEVSFAEQRVGRAGLERQFQASLRGTAGSRVEHLKRNGQLISTFDADEALDGADLRLTLDVQLQQFAESLLADALVRGTLANAANTTTAQRQPGGAIVVLECGTGAVLAAASLPSFDPNWFLQNDTAQVRRLLGDPAHPLLDRTIQMQIPPGSVFKIVTALALLDGQLDPQAAYDCRGFLRNPDQQRCAIFARYGTGHGPIALHEALVTSCNCYFFHHAALSAAEPLARWGQRLGFGNRTGIELPAEAGGQFPTPDDVRIETWTQADTQALAIGQGAITVTPLQVARLMALVATGELVGPHLCTHDDALSSARGTPSPLVPIENLRAIRAALVDVVTSPRGTAHASIRSPGALAGKTGTAEAGGHLPDHAWFAGYAPPDAPAVALVVALEHGGDAGQAAVPVAARLVEHLQRLGYFAPSPGTQVSWISHPASASSKSLVEPPETAQ